MQRGDPILQGEKQSTQCGCREHAGMGEGSTWYGHRSTCSRHGEVALGELDPRLQHLNSFHF